jgi:putative drug exporter of the RND superfamily
MAGWSRFVLAHKRLVLLFWLACLVPAVLGAGQLGSRLSVDTALPGEPGYQANQEILRRYGTGGAKEPLVPVVVLPAGTTVDSPALGRAFDALARHTGLRVVSYATTGDRRFVSADGRTTFGLVYLADQRLVGAADLGPQVTAELAGALPPGWSVRVTGIDELAAGNHAGGVTVLTLTLVGGLGALVVLAFVFGSLLALVPLLVGAVAVPVSLGLVDALAAVTPVHVVVEFMVALIGLGVAIDYSLLVVTRWREELAAGHTGDAAVTRAMTAAGPAVLFSGVTVAVGLLALLVVPVPFVRSIGYGGMVIPLVSVLVTVSLLPVLLSAAGRRLDWPHLRTGVYAGRGWSAWARGVVRRPVVAVVLALAVVVPLGVAGLNLHLGTARSDALSAAGPAHEGLLQLERAGIPTGVLTPIDVLLPAGTDAARVAGALAAVPGVYAAADPGWRQGGTALLAVLPADETATASGRATITRVRSTVAAAAPGARVGGPGTADMDLQHALYGRFPLILALLAILTYLLLIRPFRSLLLPAKAVVLNLLSIAAVFGGMTLAWQDWYGTGSVDVWIPLVVFAFLYGLSMDYEVFIVTRIREEHERTGDTRTATVTGVARTGRLVTSAALILLLALLSLASTPVVTVQVFATALGAGVLLDATLVRAVLVPALVVLFGRANWWLPGASRGRSDDAARRSPAPRHPAGAAR